MSITAPPSTPAQPALEPWEEVAGLVTVAIANAGPSFHSGILAGQVLDDIKQNKPALWAAWTASLAVDQLKAIIGRTRQSQRRASSPLARRGYSLTEEVDPSHTLRQLGDCVKSDLDYISRSYSKRAAANSLKARRFKALSQRLPDATTLVRTVIPEADVEAIYAP